MKTYQTIHQQPYCRWLMSYHLDDCERLDLYYSDAPIWTAGQIREVMRRKDNAAIGVVDQAANDELQAYMVYDCSRFDSLHVHHLAWSTELFADFLLYEIARKLVESERYNRTYATIDVHERDVRTQTLLQRYGYRWVWTSKGRDGEDIYCMRFDRA